MRKVFICLAWALMIFPVLVSGQSILAGQTSGDKIIYHDIVDLNLYSPDWNSSDAASIDLDDDGEIDLTLSTSCTYYSHIGELSVSANANAYEHCQYTNVPEHFYWVRKHTFGEVIDASLDWYTEPDPYLWGNLYNNSGDGQFVGDGYMAFRILGNDTLYGWIRMYCNPPSLTVYEYAYCNVHLGLPGNLNIPSRPSFHMQEGQLTGEIPEEIYNSSCQFNCYDVSGRLICILQPQPGIHHYPLPNLQQGLYVLRFIDRYGRVYSFKILIG